MSKTRPPYAPEFRCEMVERVRAGRDPTDLILPVSSSPRPRRSATGSRRPIAARDAEKRGATWVWRSIDYMLRRWPAFARFLGDGRICLSNNTAERALRGFALGRKAWLFAGSERGAERAAVIATLIMTAKLNDVDPQAWLADVLARSPIIPRSASTSFSPGTGGRERPTPSLKRPEAGARRRRSHRRGRGRGRKACRLRGPGAAHGRAALRRGRLHPRVGHHRRGLDACLHRPGHRRRTRTHRRVQPARPPAHDDMPAALTGCVPDCTGLRRCR